MSVKRRLLQSPYFETSDTEILGPYNPSATAGNPLKGLVGPQGTGNAEPSSTSSISSSLVYVEIGLNELMVNDPDDVGVEQAFDWRVLEDALNQASQNGQHVVLNIVSHVVGYASKVPMHVILQGMKTLEFTLPRVDGKRFSPDYQDPILLRAFEQFIEAFGAKYDGDKRIGFLHLGLLGFSGKWQTLPFDFIKDSTKESVAEWYRTAFKITKLQVPFPPYFGSEFGYLDTAFAANTLDGELNGSVSQPSYFWPTLSSSNPNVWKSAPISGDTRADLQGEIFTSTYNANTSEKQDFMRCVETTHATYVLHADAFLASGYSGQELENALASHESMGYGFRVTNVAAYFETADTVTVRATAMQTGVAPFYYPLDLMLDCSDLIDSIAVPGVEMVVEQGSSKEFTFTGVPSTADCLSKVEIFLDSPFMLRNRRIRFAQGELGILYLNITEPPDSELSLASEESSGGVMSQTAVLLVAVFATLTSLFIAGCSLFQRLRRMRPSRRRKSSKKPTEWTGSNTAQITVKVEEDVHSADTEDSPVAVEVTI